MGTVEMLFSEEDIERLKNWYGFLCSECQETDEDRELFEVL